MMVENYLMVLIGFKGKLWIEMILNSHISKGYNIPKSTILLSHFQMKGELFCVGYV